MSALRISLLACLLLQSACGFHLRGALNFPAVMDRTFVAYSGSDLEIRQQIARQLASNGVSVANSLETATARLEILSSSVYQKVLSKNAEGRPQEYRVTVELRYRLLSEDGTPLFGPDTVTRESVLALDPNDPLGARVAVDESASTLRVDAVREMLERIAASEAASEKS